MLPKIFIGSSTEGLDLAYAIQEILEQDATCTVWTQGIFDLSGNALDNLLSAVDKFDFAIFVFQPDDITKIRDKEVKTIRDNIIFEFGIFISKLGKDRVFFIIPKNVDSLHLPTDLLGIQPGYYKSISDNENLLSTLGSFCNKIRRKLKEYSRNIEKESSDNNNDTSKELVHNEISDFPSQEKKQSLVKFPEHGVKIDEFNNKIISVEPTLFFYNRFCNAFPGFRGLCWFNDPKQALKRLKILLKEPIHFEESKGHGVVSDPIWWWRGLGNLIIEHFNLLSDTRCLMNIYELEIDKIAAYHSSSYYRCFVYVEVKADKPTGVYEITKDDIERMVNDWGYATEEYGLYDGIAITRMCYNDGAAIINGEVIDTRGAELRIRYLSKYNFFIAPKFSPINSTEFDQMSEPLLNELLRGEYDFQYVCELIEQLPKHPRDED